MTMVYKLTGTAPDGNEEWIMTPDPQAHLE